MRRVKLSAFFMLLSALLSTGATLADASEGYFYTGEHGYATTFYLIGGQYTLYVYARRPFRGPYAPEARSCIFGGNFQRIWPDHDAMELGPGLPISTIVPHKIGPKPVTLPAGLYHIFVATATDCNWKFILASTNQNTAGISPVTVLKRVQTRVEPVATTSLGDLVQFYAQYRTAHDQAAPVSGTMEIIHNGQVVRTIALSTGVDRDSAANALFADVRWEAADGRYAGKNTVKFVVKIGAQEFTSSGEFTLTQ